MKATTHLNLFSKISVYLSGLCVIHCLAVPFLILMLPALSILTGNTVEIILILSVIPLSAAGFFPIWVNHKNRIYLAIYLTSIALLLVGQFVLPHNHGSVLHYAATFEHAAQLLMVVSGALGLAWVTYKNSKHTHSCKNPHHHH